MQDCKNNLEYMRLVELIDNAGVVNGSVSISAILHTYANCVMMCNFKADIPMPIRYKTVFGVEAPDDLSKYYELHNVMLKDYSLPKLLHMFGPRLVADVDEAIRILNIPKDFASLKKYPLHDAIKKIFKAKSILLRNSGKNLGLLNNATSNVLVANNIKNLSVIDKWLLEENNLQLFLCVNHFVKIDNQLPILAKKERVHIKALKNKPELAEELEAAELLRAAKRVINKLKKISELSAQVFEAANIYGKGVPKKNTKPLVKGRAYDALRTFDALETLCALVIDQKSNDLVAENHFLLPSLLEHSIKNKDGHILYFNPSPNLIRRCCMRSENLCRITFVVRDEELPLLQCSKLLKECKTIKCISSEAKLSGTRNIKNRNSVTLAVFNMSQIVLDPMSNLRLVSQWQAWFSSKADIMLYSSRPSTRLESADMLFENHISYAPVSATVLPNNLPWTTNYRRKILVQYKYNRTRDTVAHDIQLNHVSLAMAAGNAYLFSRIYSDINIPIHELDCDNTLIEHIQMLDEEKRGVIRRNQAKVFEFSPELCIHYTFAYNEKRIPYRFDAYLKLATANLLVDTDTRMTIRSEKKCLEIASNPEEWLRTNFLNQSATIKGEKKTVRQRLQLKVKGKINAESINSLCGLWLLTNIDENEKFSPETKELLNRALLATPVGWLPLEGGTQTEIEKIINEVFPDNQDDDAAMVYHLVGKLFQVAIDQDFCLKNPLRFTNAMGVSVQKQREKTLRNQAAKHVLSISQLQSLAAYIWARFPDPRFVAAYMMLVLGMRPGAICALTQDDLSHEQDYNHWQIQSWRSMSYRGVITEYDQPHQYTVFPCTPILRDLILTLKNNVDKQIGANERKLWPLLFFVDENLQDGRIPEPLRPDAVNKAVSEALSSISIPEEVHQLPSDEEGFFLTDLSTKKSILRSTFEYHALHTIRLTESELSFLLGRLSNTTLGRHYESFMDPASQHILAVKLKRFEDLLKPVQSVLETSNFSGSKTARVIKPNGPGTTNIYLELTIPQEEGAQIALQNMHGIDIRNVRNFDYDRGNMTWRSVCAKICLYRLFKLRSKLDAF